MSTPTRDLALLHAVIAYARANDWTHDSTQLDNSPLEHRWMRGNVSVSVWGGCVYVGVLEFRPASVRQAVDVLVALGHVPVEFSSAYAEAQAEIADLTALLSTKAAIIRYADERQAAVSAEIERNEARYVARGEKIVRLQAQLADERKMRDASRELSDAYAKRIDEIITATEEPDRTLTAPERRAEQEFCEYGCTGDIAAAECPDHGVRAFLTALAAARDEAEQEYIAPFGVREEPVGAVLWPAAGADDPNDEITGGAK